MKTGWKWSSVLFALSLLSPSCDQGGTSGPYDSIEGLYTCQESSVHSGVRKYFVEVDRVKDADKLYILSNFHNLGESEFLYARLSTDQLLIEHQAIRDLTVNGSGPVNEDFSSILLQYTTDNGTTLLDYTATLSR